MTNAFFTAYKMGFEFFTKGIPIDDYKAQSEEELAYFIKGYEDAKKNLKEGHNKRLN